MNVTHDLIAAVTGPGWKYGLSRILINDRGEGAVFVAGSHSPFAQFTVGDVKSNRGSGTSPQGPITWRRRGSSCQYKLAKCKVSTEQMTDRWNAYLAEIGESAEDAEQSPEAEFADGVEEIPATSEDVEPEDAVDSEDVPDGTAAEVMEWVGEDVERARAALDVEAAGKQRVGLTADLEKILAAEELL